MKTTKFDRARRAAEKALATLAEGSGTWEAAARKLDLLDNAVDWRDAEQIAEARALRAQLRGADDAGRAARAAARQVQIDALASEARAQRKATDWRNW